MGGEGTRSHTHVFDSGDEEQDHSGDVKGEDAGHVYPHVI